MSDAGPEPAIMDELTGWTDALALARPFAHAGCPADVLPWGGDVLSRRLLRAVVAPAAAADGAILHYGCRDGLLTVELARARGRPGRVLAADGWVPTLADCGRNWHPALARLSLPERLPRSFLDLIEREDAARRIVPVIADATLLNALCRSRERRFPFIVASLEALGQTGVQAVQEFGLLAGLLEPGGVLIASCARARQLDAELSRMVAAAGSFRRLDWLVVEHVAAADPPAIVRRADGSVRLRATMRPLPADHPAIPLDQLRSAADVTVVRAEETALAQPPHVLALDPHRRFQAKRYCASPRDPLLDFVVVPDGIANQANEPDSRFMRTISIADAEGRVVVDQVGGRGAVLHDWLQGHGRIDYDGPGAVIRLPADMPVVRGTVFAASAYDEYFHWHNDQLCHLPYVTDIARALGSGPLTILSLTPLNGWKRRTLELCGIRAGNYLQVAPEQPVRVDGMLVAHRRATQTTPKRAGEIFGTMQRALGITAGGGRRLYVSRADVGRRGVINEAELRPDLERLGFEIVRAVDLSYDEKARLFSEASAVIGPHGAGFTHIGFMPPGGTAIEIVSAGYKMRRGFIPRMATVFGQRYGYVVADEGLDARDNYRVDPALLIPALERLFG